jgi:hypothetical protein
MYISILIDVVCIAALIPAVLTVVNWLFYRPLPKCEEGSLSRGISVLIPARDEEGNIVGVLESVLTYPAADLEVVVLDDDSSDRTAEIVESFARRDPRVRLEKAPALPTGWCGKQHACFVLAGHASHELLVFLDADVRLTKEALPQIGSFMGRTESPDLLSGFPQQITGSFSEKLLLPLIHFILLGYLPMFLMRWSKRPAFSAGCGQLMIAKKQAYQKTGGHSMIRSSLHDGVKLPRLFREADCTTGLFDATPLATCRMYHSDRETWQGLGKNAIEGLAAPATIGPMTLLLFAGQIMPFVLLLFVPWLSNQDIALVLAACLLAVIPRWMGVLRFSHPVSSAIYHPLGIAALLVIQWQAFYRHRMGKPAEWKSRKYI